MLTVFFLPGIKYTGNFNLAQDRIILILDYFDNPNKVSSDTYFKDTFEVTSFSLAHLVYFAYINFAIALQLLNSVLPNYYYLIVLTFHLIKYFLSYLSYSDI